MSPNGSAQKEGKQGTGGKLKPELLRAVKVPLNKSEQRQLSSKEQDQVKQYAKERQSAEKHLVALRVAPEASPQDIQAAEAALKKADEDQDNGRYKDALKGIKACKDLAKAGEKRAHEALEAEKKELAKSGDFERNYNALLDRSQQIAALPTLKSEWSGLEEHLSKARGLAEQGRYTDALAELKTAEKACPGPDKENGKRLKKLQEVPALKSALEAAEQSVAALEQVAPPPVAGPYRLAVRDALAPIAGNPSPAPKEVGQAVAALKDIGQRADAEKDALEAHRTDADRLQRLVNGDLAVMAGIAPPQALAPLRQRAERIANDLTNRNYSTGLEQLKELDKDVQDLKARKAKAGQAWAAEAGKIAAARTSLAELAQGPVTSAEAAKLLAELDRLARLAEKDKEPDLAVRELSGALAAVEGQKTISKEIKDFKGRRDAANEGVVKARDAADAALKKLAEEVKKKGAPGDSLGTFRGELAQLNTTWEGRMKTARTEGELDEQGMIAAYRDLEKAASEALASPEALAKVVNQERRGEYLEALKGTREKLAALQELGGPEAVRIASALKQLDAKAADDYAGAMTRLQELDAQAEKAKPEAERGSKSMAESARLMAEAVKKEIAQLRKDVNAEEFAPFFAGLEQDVADLEGLLKGTGLDALRAANHELSNLRHQMADIRQKLGASGPDRDTFKDVLQLAAGLEKELKDEQLAELVPTLLKLLQEQFKRAREEIKSQGPTAANVTLRELRAQITQAKESAGLAKAKRGLFASSRGLAEELLKKLDPRAKYTADLKTRLAALAPAEGTEDQALKGLSALKHEISEALSKPEAFQSKEKEVLAALAEKERQRVTWEASYKAFFSDDLARAKLKVEEHIKLHGEGGPSQLKDLERLAEQAKDLASKSEDYKGALKQLELARARAAEVMSSPMGLKASSRGNLPGANRRWKEAVSAFNASIHELSETIAKAAGTDFDATALQGLAKQFRILTQEFDPKAFDGPIAVLTRKGEKAAVLREAREEALRAVRRYQGTLLKDPLLAQVLRNPFKPVATTPLYAALNDVDTNVQRGV
jgi:hypothetical protein